MKAPVFTDATFTDKSGKLTDTWRNILSQLLDQLIKNYSENGLFIPKSTAANIAKFNNAQHEGALLYNTDDKSLYVCLNGTFKKVTTS